MDIKKKDMRQGIITLAVAVFIASVVYSCSSQHTMAKAELNTPSLGSKKAVEPKYAWVEFTVEDIYVKKQAKPHQQVDEKSLVKAGKTIDTLVKDKKLYDAIKVLAEDRVNVANSYRRLTGRFDSLTKEVKSYRSAYVASETERKRIEKENRLKEDLNNNIVKWSLSFIAMFSIGTFLISWSVHRRQKKSSNS